MLSDDRIGRYDNFAGSGINDGLGELQSEDTFFPAEFLRYLIATDGRKVITPLVKELRVEQRGSVFRRRHFTGTQSVVQAEQGFFLIVFAVVLIGVEHVDESLKAGSQSIFFVKQCEIVQQVFEIGEAVVFRVELRVGVEQCAESFFVVTPRALQVADGQRVTRVCGGIGLQELNELC